MDYFILERKVEKLQSVMDDFRQQLKDLRHRMDQLLPDPYTAVSLTRSRHGVGEM